MVAVDPRLTQARLDTASEVLADYADLESPYLGGHSAGVADVAAVAAGLVEYDVVVLRRAALVHDLGRTGAPQR